MDALQGRTVLERPQCFRCSLSFESANAFTGHLSSCRPSTEIPGLIFTLHNEGNEQEEWYLPSEHTLSFLKHRDSCAASFPFLSDPETMILSGFLDYHPGALIPFVRVIEEAVVDVEPQEPLDRETIARVQAALQLPEADRPFYWPHASEIDKRVYDFFVDEGLSTECGGKLLSLLRSCGISGLVAKSIKQLLAPTKTLLRTRVRGEGFIPSIFQFFFFF